METICRQKLNAPPCNTLSQTASPFIDNNYMWVLSHKEWIYHNLSIVMQHTCTSECSLSVHICMV